jgi:hypothetical protein
MKLLIVAMLICSGQVFAHGDHSAPGAIPPSPNGGVLSEAKHEHKGSHHHDHKKAEEREIFFEAKLKNKLLTVYPLELDHKTGNVFKALKVGDFSKVKMSIKDPRKKSDVKFELKAKSDHWQLKLGNNRVRRVIVEVSGIFKEAKYKANVQVERN